MKRRGFLGLLAVPFVALFGARAPAAAPDCGPWRLKDFRVAVRPPYPAAEGGCDVYLSTARHLYRVAVRPGGISHGAVSGASTPETWQRVLDSIAACELKAFV